MRLLILVFAILVGGGCQSPRFRRPDGPPRPVRPGRVNPWPGGGADRPERQENVIRPRPSSTPW